MDLVEILILDRNDLVIGRENKPFGIISKHDFNIESMSQMKYHPITIFKDTDGTKKVLCDRWMICKTN